MVFLITFVHIILALASHLTLVAAIVWWLLIVVTIIVVATLMVVRLVLLLWLALRGVLFLFKVDVLRQMECVSFFNCKVFIKFLFSDVVRKVSFICFLMVNIVKVAYGPFKLFSLVEFKYNRTSFAFVFIFNNLATWKLKWLSIGSNSFRLWQDLLRTLTRLKHVWRLKNELSKNTLAFLKSNVPAVM